MIKKSEDKSAGDGRLVRLERDGVLKRSPTNDPLRALGEPVACARGLVEALLDERRPPSPH